MTQIEIDQSCNSVWQYCDVTYQLSGTMPEIRNKLSLLRAAFPDQQVQIQLQFESFQTLQKFQKKLEQQQQTINRERTIDKNDFFNIWTQIYQKTRLVPISQIQNKPTYRIIFSHPLTLTIFYRLFEKDLLKLQRQHNYTILPYRKILKVYLNDENDQKISSFFTAEIIGMKKSFSIYIQNDEKVYQIVSYSKMAQQRLQKQNIHFIILSHSKQVCFYSTVVRSATKINLMTKKLLSYHVSLIKFPSQSMDQYIFNEIVGLITNELKPVFRQVTQKFEQPVQVDVEKGSIVINDRHEVFSDGRERIESELWQLKVIEFECRDLVEVRKILAKQQYRNIVKNQFKHRKCFLLFPYVKQRKQQRLLQQLLNQLKPYFTQNYTLIIHFLHLYNNDAFRKAQIERIINLAAFLELNIVTYHRIAIRQNSKFYKVVIEPKELGRSAGQKRAQNIKKMLINYLVNKDATSEMKKYPIFSVLRFYNKNGTQKLMWYEKEEQNQFVQRQKNLQTDQQKDCNLSLCFSNKNVPTIQDPQPSTPSLPTLIQQPQTFRIEQSFQLENSQKQLQKNTIYIRGKRSFKAQEKLQKKFNRKLKAWKIIINSSITLPNIKTFHQLAVLSTNIQKYEKNTLMLKRFSQTDHRPANQFNQGQTALISIVNREKDQFIPIYEIQFVE